MSGITRLAARDIPVPGSISPEAQAMFVAIVDRPVVHFPDGNDAEAWRTAIAAAEANILPVLQPLDGLPGLKRETATIAGVPTYLATPEGAPEDRAYLDIHGGGLVMMGGEATRLTGLVMASRVGVATWSPDYRMPPDHPYPAALDDCVAVYRAMLERFPPHRIVAGGASAGGNLAAALALRLRDEGLPLPAGLVLLTPELDLTESGDSFTVLRDIDVMLRRPLMGANRLYAAGADLTDPYLSPLFGDFSKGYPPTLLQAGTRDLFLSNAVRMHRLLLKAGVPVELHVFEGMPHGGFGGAPEDQDLAETIGRFVAACFERAG
jgi:acetyl esterase/lipase